MKIHYVLACSRSTLRLCLYWDIQSHNSMLLRLHHWIKWNYCSYTLKPGKFALVFKIKLYEFEQCLAAQHECVLTGLVRYWNICGANFLDAISVLLSVLAENGVYYGNDADAHNLWDRWQQHNCLNKYLHLQLYLHTASGYRRRLALNCSVVMNNKNNRDTPLLYHISNRNNLCPNRDLGVSWLTAIHVRNEAVATWSNLWWPIPLPVDL